MKLVNIFGLFCLLQHSDGDGNQHTPHGYMTHYYYGRRHVEVNDSLLLELTNRFLPDERKDFLTCDVKVVTSSNRRILVHIMSLEISEDDLDRLHVYDYSSDRKSVRISPAQGLYGVYDKYYSGFQGGVQDFVSTKNELKLDYQGKPTLTYDGFKILLTAFTESRGDCGPGYFRCNRKQICIPISTRCDGYPNCGNNDLSDEDGCDLGLGNTWRPWDGQVTAVVVSALACTVFLLTAGIIFFIIMRINKRDVINTNITVEFRKKKKSKHRSTNRENLTRLYAPPSYEVVVGMDEEPPPYESVEDGCNTETDDEDGILREHVTHNTESACVSLPSACVSLPSACVSLPNENGPNKEANQNLSVKDLRVTSVLVTCDIDGNNICTQDSNITVEYEVDEQNQTAEFQNLTNLKLCTSEPLNIDARKTDAPLQNGECIVEQESVSIDPDAVDINIEITRGKVTNGTALNVTSNGHIGPEKCNGHSKVAYKRTPSKREPETIEYIDSD